MKLVHKLNHAGDRIVGAKGSAVETARGRLMFVSVMVALAFAAVGVRIGYLCLYQQGAEPRYEALRVAKGGTTADTLALGRADIVDRNGVLLATTLPTISLYADPKLVDDAQKITDDLRSIFADLDTKNLSAKLSGRGRFVWVRRGITPDEARAVNALGYPALNIRNENKRFYPQESLMAHVVGYTDIDGSGLAGIERSQDNILKNGGEPLKLTVDVRHQHALRRALETEMRNFEAAGATGVVMDVHTGEVLAAVSLPDFDPHASNISDDDSRFNRFAIGVYEMGSTLKAFTLAAYLEAEGTSFNKYFDATRPLRRGKHPIGDFQPKNRVLSLPEVMMVSSNIGSILMAEAVGTQNFRQFLNRFGMLSPLDTDLGERGAPMVPRQWRDISTVSASYGYGIAVSPLHMVRGYAALVNGGVLPQVHFVQSLKQANNSDKIQSRILDEHISQRTTQLLRLVVSQGTGGKAGVPGMNVGGKTGTAQKNVGGRYVKDRRFTSFTGFFPAENPRYAIIVALDDPKGNKKTHGFATAGWVAAPAMASTVAAIRDIENLPNSSLEMDLALESEVEPLLKDKLKTGLR